MFSHKLCASSLLTGNESATSFTIGFKLFLPPNDFLYDAGITFTTMDITDASYNFYFGDGAKFLIYFYSNHIFFEASLDYQYTLVNPCDFGVWCHLAFVYNSTSHQLQLYKDGVFSLIMATDSLNFYDSNPTYGSGILFVSLKVTKRVACRHSHEFMIMRVFGFVLECRVGVQIWSWGGKSDYPLGIYCLQLFDRALSASELALVKRTCEAITVLTLS